MDTDDSENLLIPVKSETPGNDTHAIDQNNLHIVRRRNVVEDLIANEKQNSIPSNRIPLVVMPNSIRAWIDCIPNIPDITHLISHKSNRTLTSNIDASSNNEVLSNRERMKISVIKGSIVKPDLTLGEFKLLGCSSEGFVHDEIRRILWPKLLRLSSEKPITEGLECVYTLIPNEVYQQILKDVARSGSHIPVTATQEDTDIFQKELTQLICWVLHKQPELNYYQGYNDIAATILLVMGLEKSLRILEIISIEYLKRFMEKTMEKVNQELFYIFALLERVHPTLLEHLENVELFPHFALAEYTTWYAHKYAENRRLLHRLFDYFLGSPLMMPLYLSTVIVAHRATEIFNTTPDMGHTHKVLCTLPDDLPFEKLLVDAKNLYRDYPPESINNDVKEYDSKRRCKEQEWKIKAETIRRDRERRQQLRIVQTAPRYLPYRIGNYKTITVVTILAIGLYALLKNSSGL